VCVFVCVCDCEREKWMAKCVSIHCKWADGV